MATAIYNPKNEITAMGEASKKAAQVGLATARDKNLEQLSYDQKKIAPEYLKQRNTVDVGSQVAAKNFSEFLAQRGQNTATGLSGTQAQANLTNSAVRQGSMGQLAAGEALANTENQRGVTQTNVAYNSGLASSNATIGAKTMGDLISAQQAYNTQKMAQENADRVFNAQQTQQKLDNAFRQQQLASSNANAAAARRSSSSGGSSRSSGGSSRSSKPVTTTADTNNMLGTLDQIVTSRAEDYQTRQKVVQEFANQISTRSGTQADYLKKAASKAYDEIENQKNEYRYSGSQNIYRGQIK